MAKQIISSAFLLGLVSMSIQLSLQEQPNSCIKPPTKQSIVKFNIDDVVSRVALNGNDLVLNMTPEEKGDWMYTHTTQTYLYPGDVISITGYDQQGGQGMLGTIQYYDANNSLSLIHTGGKWLCNGKKPNVQSPNNGSVWPYVPCIDSSARWIWNSARTATGEEVTCSYKLPNGY